MTLGRFEPLLSVPLKDNGEPPFRIGVELDCRIETSLIPAEHNAPDLRFVEVGTSVIHGFKSGFYKVGAFPQRSKPSAHLDLKAGVGD